MQNSSKVFTCNDVGLQELEIWVFDSSGNSDFCRTSLEIQANNACQSASGAMISGFITTENGDPVKDAMVELVHATQSEDYYYATKSSGRYEFPDMPMFDDYRISSSKSSDYLDGVSTLDLVLIQNHILGINVLSSPYKIIAADANNSQSVTGSDVIQLRKLILGDYQELPNNTSWRVINADQTFADQDTPWPFTEEVFLNGLNKQEFEQDFIAIKIGDINGSSKVNSAQNQIEKRNNNQRLALAYESADIQQGNRVSVPLLIRQNVSISGIQSTLEYNASALDFIGIESSLINISDANYLIHDNGKVTLSWNSSGMDINLAEGESFIELIFNARSNTQLGHLELNSNITMSEAYNDDLDIIEVSLDKVDQSLAYPELISLEQNSPNPFTEETSIKFSIPSNSNVVLRVYDAAGKEVYYMRNSFEKGQNQIILTQDELKSSGMLYYQIEVGDEILTKKMIHIK